MPRGPFAPFLDFVRSRRRAVDDHAELLARFAADRDEDAFAELVRRHGPLVWGVARQVLGHDQDAEDAFQATFLLLARNAETIRTAAAVAGWLHGTAWRVATKARTRSANRQRREQSTPSRPKSDPAAEAALRELQALLHAEIAVLPAKNRTPFVLCVMEGRSRAEVEKSLGSNEGTLSTRLAWARQRLRSRLLRRGVDLAAALAAIELARDATAALPATLARSAVAAARTGVATAAVAALAHGGLMTSKYSPLAALGLVLGVIAIGTAGLMGSDPPVQLPAKEQPNPKPAAAAPAGRPAGNCSFTASGTVTGPDGKPLAGATVFLRTMNRNDKSMSPAKTDAQGHYEFNNVSVPMSASIRVTSPTDRVGVRKLMYQVCAIADGMAVEWAPEVQSEIKAEKAEEVKETRYSAGSATVDVKLAPAAHFQGRLVDDQGWPVAGAKVQMIACDHLSLRAMPLALTVNLGRYRQTGYLPEDRTTATTGADGRFRIDGVPADAIAAFSIKHPDFASLTAVASLVDPKTVPPGAHISTIIPRNPNGLGGKIIVGDIDLKLTAPRLLAIEVLSSTTGKPVANAHVSIGPRSPGRGRGIAAQRPPDSPTPHASGTTDDAGKVTLQMPPGDYTLLAFAPNRVPPNPPPPNSVYYGRQQTPITIKDEDGQSQIIRLEPACKIDLEVMDAGTGKPIAGQPLSVEMEHGIIPGVTRGPPAPPPIPGQPSGPRPPRVPVVDWRRTDGDPIPTPRTDADGKATTWANPGKGHIRVNLNRQSEYEDFTTPAPVTLEAAGEVKLRVELRKKP
jgi:RNA polymerase sigma factor (sigma-70 family)